LGEVEKRRRGKGGLPPIALVNVQAARQASNAIMQ